MRINELDTAINNYLTNRFKNFNIKYSPASVYGHIIEVLKGLTQNYMFYLEDSLTEQNKYTAQRRRSVMGLASQSGYQTFMGRSARGTLTLQFLQNANDELESQIVYIPNNTQVKCSLNGLIYNTLFNSDMMVVNTNTSDIFYLPVVEGKFETQIVVGKGVELQTFNFDCGFDCVDFDYVTVSVDGEEWGREYSIYDMMASTKGYILKSGINNTFDIEFGVTNHGVIPKVGSNIVVKYLLHSGANGNIQSFLHEHTKFTFESDIYDYGMENVSLTIDVCILQQDGSFSGGSNMETIDTIREMIGYNSRSLVLASPENYNHFLSTFDDIGYKRVWSPLGSLLVNALLLPNIKSKIENGGDYFTLTNEDFRMTTIEKNNIQSFINKSGSQLAGSELQILDYTIKKYSCLIWVKKSEQCYNEDALISYIKNTIGGFFSEIVSDEYIPISDIIYLFKDNTEIESINVYFISEDNELAKKNGYYYVNVNSYESGESVIIYKKVEVAAGVDPHVGMDTHGNILLDTNTYFPVLMGGLYLEDGITYIEDGIKIIINS